MIDHISLSHILSLDIETVPQYPVYDAVPHEVQTMWNRKAEYIKRKEDETNASVYNRAGIYAEFGKIICISTGFLSAQGSERQFRIKSFYGDDERKVLEEFSSMLSRFKNKIILCAHNGKEFDFPYIARRMVIQGLALPDVLNYTGRKPWEVPHLDTMELWKFGDFKHYTPLNLLAHVLGIPSPKDDIDGSQVHQVYWQEKNLQRIVTYCQKDVVTVMQILLKLKRQNLLSNEEITLVE